MATHITAKDLDAVLALARLKLDPRARERLMRDVEEIVAYISRLSSVDTDSVPAYSGVPRVVAELRSDDAKPFVDRDALVAGERFTDSMLVTKGIFSRTTDHESS